MSKKQEPPRPKEESIGDKLSGFFESTREGMSYLGGKLGSIQEYLSEQFKLADCCNNVTLVNDSMRLS